MPTPPPRKEESNASVAKEKSYAKNKTLLKNLEKSHPVKITDNVQLRAGLGYIFEPLDDGHGSPSKMK